MFFNLPRKVVFAGGDSISYVYAADGRKLRSLSVIRGVTTKTDYCGNVIYENGFRKYLLVDGGYFSGKNTAYLKQTGWAFACAIYIMYTIGKPLRNMFEKYIL